MRLSVLATGSVRMIRYVDFFLAYRMSENWFAQYISKRGFKFILLIVLKKEKKKLANQKSACRTTHAISLVTASD